MATFTFNKRQVDEIIEAAPLVREREESLLWHTVKLYLLKTPQTFLMIAPYLTVMSAMFSLSRLRKNNELVPMIMAGVSLFRILLPIFAMAGIFLAAMVLFQEYLAPWCAPQRMLKESLLIHQEEERPAQMNASEDPTSRPVTAQTGLDLESAPGIAAPTDGSQCARVPRADPRIVRMEA